MLVCFFEFRLLLSIVRAVFEGVHEWRKHPAVLANTNIRYMFPGLGVAVVAFTGFMIAEKMLAVAAPAHEETHGHGHH